MPPPVTIVPRVWGQAPYPAGSGFGPRLCRDWEWVWIDQGGARWEVDDQVHHLEAGDAVLVQPGMRDRFRWDGQRGVRHGYLHFQIRGEEPRLAQPVWRGHPFLPGLLRHALAALEAGDLALGRHAVEHSLVLVQAGSGGQQGTQDPVVERVLEGVTALWGEGPCRAIALTRLCRLAGLGPAQLHRRFQAALGVGPATALRRMRLERARHLLDRTELTLEEIARLTGFADAFHLSHAFRRVEGMSPRDRRKGRGGAT